MPACVLGASECTFTCLEWLQRTTTPDKEGNCWYARPLIPSLSLSLSLSLSPSLSLSLSLTLSLTLSLSLTLTWRSAGMLTSAGTRTPEVVPLAVKMTSWLGLA